MSINEIRFKTYQEACDKLVDAVNAIDQANDMIKAFAEPLSGEYRQQRFDLEDALVIVDKLLAQYQRITGEEF